MSVRLNARKRKIVHIVQPIYLFNYKRYKNRSNDKKLYFSYRKRLVKLRHTSNVLTDSRTFITHLGQGLGFTICICRIWRYKASTSACFFDSWISIVNFEIRNSSLSPPQWTAGISSLNLIPTGCTHPSGLQVSAMALFWSRSNTFLPSKASQLSPIVCPVWYSPYSSAYVFRLSAVILVSATAFVCVVVRRINK